MCFIPVLSVLWLNRPSCSPDDLIGQGTEPNYIVILLYSFLPKEEEEEKEEEGKKKKKPKTSPLFLSCMTIQIQNLTGDAQRVDHGLHPLSVPHHFTRKLLSILAPVHVA